MIDMSKEYVTRGEKLPVRLYATDGGGAYPVHGAILSGDEWAAMAWREEGSWSNSSYDLIEKPQTVTRWVNVYDNGFTGGGYDSREMAYGSATSGRIGVLRIEYTGDQFEVFKEEL